MAADADKPVGGRRLSASLREVVLEIVQHVLAQGDVLWRDRRREGSDGCRSIQQMVVRLGSILELGRALVLQDDMWLSHVAASTSYELCVRRVVLSLVRHLVQRPHAIELCIPERLKSVLALPGVRVLASLLAFCCLDIRIADLLKETGIK